jgi:uncharacterized protein
MYYRRKLEKEIIESIEHNPVTAILGPRQCGKSTLAKYIAEEIDSNILYLDLERPSDLQKLDDPEWFLSTQKDKLICLDEIQRIPELFPLIRSLVDEWGENSHFLVLGSASKDLIKQSSESLAGRISYKQLSPFLWDEIKESYSLEDYLVRGGFPRSTLAQDENISYKWREDFITTFLERDLMLWSGFSPVTMRKLWQMLAHLNGQIINYSTLARSLGVSNTTAKNYTEMLASAFMVTLLQPYLPNLGKRLVKSPKIFLNDTGISNALLGIESFEQLSGHPSMGAIWENMVLSNLMGTFPGCHFYFYRTGHGAEIDLILENKGRIIAVECKASLSPRLEKGTFSAIEDMNPDLILVVSPVKSGWSMRSGVMVVNLDEAIDKIKEHFFG